jgi:hypothetical protein
MKNDFDEDSLIVVHSFDTALPQEIQLSANNEIKIFMNNGPLVRFELSDSVCCLFLNNSEYNNFVAEINKNPTNKIGCVDNVDWIDYLVKTAEKEEMDIDKQIKDANIEKENYEKKTDDNHGFDTAMPKEILKAINDGRIIPFKRTIRRAETKETKN